MNRFSQPVSRAWMLGGSLLTTLGWGASPALTAETFYAPHAIHQGTQANPTSPNPFPGAPAARSTNQQVLVQPTAFQGNGQAPAGNGAGSSVQQHLDDLYRKEGREAPQMNLPQTPITPPNQAGQSRQPNMQQTQRPMVPAGSNVVSPKSRSGILSRINPFKSKSSSATQYPSSAAPPPPPPGNQTGYAQQPNFSGQNQANQFDNRANQTNGQLNQTNGQNNNQANPPGNPVQQFGNQARQFNNQGQQFNNQGQQLNNQGQQFNNQGQQLNNQGQQLNNQGQQLNNQNQQFNARPEMSIQPGQRSNIAPPMAPPSNNGDELTLPTLPGESGFETPVEAPPTDFGPNAPKIQKSEPDLLKDVFSDEPELAPPTKPQRQPTKMLNDEPPIDEPKRNAPTPVTPIQTPEPLASESDEPFIPQSRFKEDTTLDRIPLPIDEAPIVETTSESLPPVAEKRAPPVAVKPMLSEVHDLQLDEKLKIIAERGELRGLKGFCPVGLRDDRDLKNALPEFHSIYKGRTYYFHSADAKTIFDENPRFYAPAASGLDVVLRKSKVLKEGSLDFALWYKERLYLFTSQKTLEQFVATPKEFVAID